MKHHHIYDADGRQICCTEEEKVNAIADKKLLAEQGKAALPLVSDATKTEIKNVAHTHGHAPDHPNDDGHGHSHDVADTGTLSLFLKPAVSLILLLAALALDHLIPQNWFTGWPRILWYVAAYLPVGLPVLKEAVQSALKGGIFSEFFLMSLATSGAFALGEYPEGVAVMLFYSVGEVFQSLAVTRAKTNIKSLLDQRPDEVTVLENKIPRTVKAAEVQLGSILQLKLGEKLGLDGELLSERASFNTAALTGESTPDSKKAGDTVYAGMINLNTVSEVRVTTAYRDSKLSRILELVQDATAQKAPTELFIRRFAKVYTPLVVLGALLICLVPALFVENYRFADWLYRALVFLVISCPCALVISIPLGYFGGIGAASRNGILFKGSNFLDQIAGIRNVVMDKTGTLTEGVFEVQEVHIENGFERDKILQLTNALESKSTHPIATAIRRFIGEVSPEISLSEVEEIAGHGLRAVVDGKELLVGNFKLLARYDISFDAKLEELQHTVVAIALGGKFAGYLTIADRIKSDAAATIKKLSELGIKTTMLSGDKDVVVQLVAGELGIKNAFGGLLPEDKVVKVEEIKARGESVAFVGDGVNDAPVVALSDVGIAMGGLGSDATIETADIVIQDDRPIKIPMAVNIGKQTKKIVWQNISLAFTVKAAVLLLGAGGLATMWEAVFADVGVALLAILNAVRIQKMKF